MAFWWPLRGVAVPYRRGGWWWWGGWLIRHHCDDFPAQLAVLLLACRVGR